MAANEGGLKPDYERRTPQVKNLCHFLLRWSARVSETTRHGLGEAMPFNTNGNRNDDEWPRMKAFAISAFLSAKASAETARCRHSFLGRAKARTTNEEPETGSKPVPLSSDL